MSGIKLFFGTPCVVGLPNFIEEKLWFALSALRKFTHCLKYNWLTSFLCGITTYYGADNEPIRTDEWVLGIWIYIYGQCDRSKTQPNGFSLVQNRNKRSGKIRDPLEIPVYWKQERQLFIVEKAKISLVKSWIQSW